LVKENELAHRRIKDRIKRRIKRLLIEKKSIKFNLTKNRKSLIKRSKSQIRSRYPFSVKKKSFFYKNRFKKYQINNKYKYKQPHLHKPNLVSLLFVRSSYKMFFTFLMFMNKLVIRKTNMYEAKLFRKK